MKRVVSGLMLPVRWALFYAVLLGLGAIQLAWAPMAFALRHLLSPARGRVIGRRFISGLYRDCFRITGALGLLKVDATALDAIDPLEPLIVAPNHPSVLDALLLVSRLDNLCCIMKASVRGNVLLGAASRLAGYIRNDGPRRMLRLSVAELKRGGQLIIFPEATRTIAAPVNDFTSGFAAIARMAKVPVQAVVIEADTPFLAKGWPVLRPPSRFPMTFRVRLGPRFEVGQDVDAFVVELRAWFVRELVDARLGDLWDRPRREAVPGSSAPGRESTQPSALPPVAEALRASDARLHR